MVMDWKNQYSKNEYTTQSNLQIQCNPYQITNGIFSENQNKKILKIYGDTKDPEQPKQSCGKKKNGAGGIRLSDLKLHYKAVVIKTL